jgi:large subunit GTPase 1
MVASGAKSIGLDVDPNIAASNKIKSVLETDDLTDFLARAELADREFESERERFVVIDQAAQEVKTLKGGNVTAASANNTNTTSTDGHLNDFDFTNLTVPRRPKWDKNTTPAELDRNEKESFLEWRRNIAIQEEKIASHSNERIAATPFEKNIEVWRQLWRVIERSHIVVLVVDGRNPQFYVSLDLRKYVEEELGKNMIVVVNKCDYLTQKQRLMWHEYFKSLDGLEHVFFSAVKEQEILDGVRDEVETEDQEEPTKYVAEDGYPTMLHPSTIGIETPLKRKELIDILCEYAEMNGVQEALSVRQDDATDRHSRLEFGMVGFPNVGKSSVLNVLVGASKNNHQGNRVAVAAMPGKTKHFQTLNVPDYNNITLVDCPGLVFPSFVSSNADLILAGVYPLPQVRDFWPAVELICKRIPRNVLEAYYGIKLPRPSVLDVAQKGGHVSLQAPTGEELLGTYCISRSLLAASSGIPNYWSAARVILKDYTNGNLLFCHCPPCTSSPDMDDKKWEQAFHQETLATCFLRQKKLQEKLGVKMITEPKEPNSIETTTSSTVEPSNDPSAEEEFDLDLLEMIESDTKPAGGNRAKNHKTMQKHGKKGRKFRNKDPYGCHSDPDAALLASGALSGVSVKAGKYSSSNYTRMNIRGPRSANISS